MSGGPSVGFDLWRLDDGTVVTIRPIRRSDAALELAFLDGLSARTRYQRLLSTRKLLPGELRRLIDVDFSRDMALIATVRVLGLEVQIGVARYVRLVDESSAEFAIVIADDWQGRRLGERLLGDLLEAASAHGLTRLTGITLTTNTAMLTLARRLGFRLALEPGDATVTRVEKVTDPAPAEGLAAAAGLAALLPAQRLAASPPGETRPHAAKHAR